MVTSKKSKVSFNLQEAADSTGYSVDVLRRAIRAGDLATSAPRVNGRTITRRVIKADELERWIESGDPA